MFVSDQDRSAVKYVAKGSIRLGRLTSWPLKAVPRALSLR
jgi:hypothetical protein